MTIRVLCVLLLILSWISVNIYLPALPALEHVFHTSSANLKLSLTLFFTSFAISQLFWGPISEKYGRKKPLLIGMIFTSLGVIMTMLSNSVWIFNSGRFIEAIGLGCAPVLGRAILADVLDKTALSITWAYTTVTSNSMPAIAPILGGQLMLWFGWRSIFLFLLIYNVVLYISTYKHLPETNIHIQPKLKLGNVFSQYWEACTHKKFMGYLLPYILLTGGTVGYYAATPFIFITHLHISPQNYGFLSLITVGTYIIGALLSRFLSKRLDMDKQILLGTLLAILSGVIFCIIAIFFAIGIFSILIPMSIFTFSAGFISPGTNAGALFVLRHLAGASSAVTGTSLYAASAIFSTIAADLSFENLWPLAIYIVLISLAAFISFFFMVFFNKLESAIIS